MKITPLRNTLFGGLPRLNPRHLSLAVTLGGIFLIAPGVHAQWIVTGTGSFNYGDSANWTGGDISGRFTGNFFPNGATNNAIQAVTFSTDTTIDNLTFAPSSGAGYANTSVQFQSAGGASHTLTLGGTIDMIAIDAGNGSYLNIGSTNPANALNISLGDSATIRVDGGTGNSGYLSLLNTVAGAGSLTKTGFGSLDILGATTIGGPVNIDSGAVRVLGSDGVLASETINIAAGSALMLLNASTPMNGAGVAGASSSRISDTAAINLNGGWADNMISFNHANRAAFGITVPIVNAKYYLDFGNLVVEGAVNSTAVNETVGIINLQSGISRVNLRTNSATTGNVTLTSGSLTRAAGAAITFSGGYGSSQNDNTLFQTIGGAQGADSSVGQTYVKFTTAPTLTGGILPYALVAMDNIYGYGSGGENEFATYDAVNGIVPYSRTGTYVTNLSAPTGTDNVKLSGATTLGLSGAINSLTIDNGTGSAFSVGGTGSPTLTILSGAILRTGGTQKVTLANTLTLDFNNQEAFIYGSTGAMQIDSALTNIGTAGINFVNPSNSSGVNGSALIFNGSISPNVPVRLLAGSMRLNTNLATNVVTIDNGATLALPRNDTIGGLDGDGAVRLQELTLTIGGGGQNTTFSGNIYGDSLKDSATGFAPFLSNGGNIVKTGANSLTLSGANTYSGTTTISQGTLIAGTDAASTSLSGATRIGSLTATTSNTSAKTFTGNLANGSVICFVGGDASPFSKGDTGYEGTNSTVVYYVINSSGGAFQLSATPGGAALTPSTNTTSNYQQIAALSVDPTANTLTLPSGAGTVANGNIIYLNATAGIVYPTGLTGSVPYYVVNASGDGASFQVSRTLGGAAIDFTSAGSGVFAIRPGAFGSGTSAVVIGDSSSGTAPKALLTGGAFTIERDVIVTGTAAGGTGIATLGGNTDGNSTFSGTVSLGATTQLTSMTTGSKAVTFSGVLSGTGGITKVGSGNVIVSGSSNYSGATTVSEGRLTIATGGVIGNGAIAVNAGTLNVNGGTGTGGLTVASGATLSGTGSIGGGSVVSGSLRPGNDGVGVLTFNNTLTLAGTTYIEINDTVTRGTGYDGVNVLAGTMTFGGALKLEFGNLDAFSDNISLTIFSFDGASLGDFASVTSTGFYSGTWTNALDDNLWSFNNGTQMLTFNEADGTLVAAAIPEPSVFGLFAGSIGCLLVRWKMRNRRSIAWTPDV